MKKQLLILVCGPCGSGKTVLSEKITAEFPFIQHLQSQGIRDLISTSFPFYKNMDSSQNDFKKRSVNRVSRSFMGNMLDELVKAGESVLFDATLLRSDTRQWRIKAAKEHKKQLETVIIAMNTDPKVIESRLAERDALSIDGKWVENYKEFVLSTYELPKDSEADHVFHHEGDDQACIDFIKQAVA